MGYHVDYAPVKQTRNYEKRICTLSALTVLFAIIFCLLVNCTWPRGAAVLKQFLFPEDLSASTSAMEDMEQKMQSGDKLRDAASGFWYDLLQIIG